MSQTVIPAEVEESIPAGQPPNNQAEASTLPSNPVDQISATEPPTVVPIADLSD